MEFGFVTRDIRAGLVYSGNISEIDSCIDDVQALNRYKGRLSDVKFQRVNFDLYGKKQSFTLPIVSQNDIDTKNRKVTEATTEFKEYTTKYGKLRLISDIVLGIRKQVLMDYDVIYLDDNEKGWICFKEKIVSLKTIQLPQEEKSFRLFQKEYMDGYVRVTPYKYKKGKDIVEIQLGSEYEYEGNIVKHNYTSGLRKAMFFNANKKIGREKMMMDRQSDVIKRMGHVTYIVAPRRAGKTFLAGFLCNRELITEKFSMQTQLRPLSIIYIGLTRTKNMKVVNYIKRMAAEMGFADGSMYHFDGQSNIFSFRSGKDVIAEVTFVSAEGTDPGIGDYADFIILDECGKLPVSIYNGIQPIVYTEGAKLLCISTLYADSQKGWFYENLLDAEKNTIDDVDGLIDEYRPQFQQTDLTTNKGQQEYEKLVKEFQSRNFTVGLRYTIDDIEYDFDKERLKKKYSGTTAYFAELYSRFPDEGKLFIYEPSLIGKEKIYGPLYREVVVGYDPAMTVDNPAVIVAGYDESKKKVVVLEEYQLEKKGKYEQQAEQIKLIMKNARRYLVDPMKGYVYFAMDGTQKAVADALEIKGLTINLRIAYTSGADVNASKNILNEQKVPKDILVQTTKNLFDNNKLFINMELTGLCKELDYFQRIQLPSGRFKFEAVGGHDDKVNALMIACFYFYSFLGVKYEVFKPEPKLPKGNTKEDLAKHYQIKKLEDELKEGQIKLEEARADYYRNFIY